MMLLGTQSVNAAGHLQVGGCDALELAAEFGTPLYVLDEAHLRATAQAYRRALAAHCRHSRVYYASKALTTTAVIAMMVEEGLAFDVASAGELQTALAGGADPADLLLHGNYKSSAEMRLALTSGVGRICVDSLSELAAWDALAGELGVRAGIYLRVNPNVQGDTHASISTGQIDSKFGLSIQSGAAEAAVAQALRARHLDLVGLHCHIGSQILEAQPFADAAAELADFAADLRTRHGLTLRELDLGGGLGIRYLPSHQPPSIAEFVGQVVETLRARLAEHDYPIPTLCLEPGRSLVGEAGLTLYTIGPVKPIPGVRTYVSVDGGLSDNPRPAMYQSPYHVFLADRPTAEADGIYTVAGKHCETDTLFPDVPLAAPAEGGILAVQSTGAYNYAMASNYNRLPRPAMVTVRDGQAEVIVSRESVEDTLRSDRLPARLARRR